ncbi:uncharacterized protein EV422DRAFT_505227 [Fimicolochytrium jonesii]|uniref:uncharacterized protein n=1 Tax=Fimicolochytrium jonesii TaxID=1396493 RepID=UPI0022FDDE8E|nr:uncharacterized protein EV422DRAFT_505227 [Fimicolochytrium jonesii]KAI8822385.1 hypothetical protein EV422DRAFT_505227 [Fimicolochytrium jonesii]
MAKSGRITKGKARATSERASSEESEAFGGSSSRGRSTRARTIREEERSMPAHEQDDESEGYEEPQADECTELGPANPTPETPEEEETKVARNARQDVQEVQAVRVTTVQELPPSSSPGSSTNDSDDEATVTAIRARRAAKARAVAAQAEMLDQNRKLIEQNAQFMKQNAELIALLRARPVAVAAPAAAPAVAEAANLKRNSGAQGPRPQPFASSGTPTTATTWSNKRAAPTTVHHINTPTGVPEYKKPRLMVPRLTPEERERCMHNGLCLRCRQPGHMAAQCPEFNPPATVHQIDATTNMPIPEPSSLHPDREHQILKRAAPLPAAGRETKKVRFALDTPTTSNPLVPQNPSRVHMNLSPVPKTPLLSVHKTSPSVEPPPMDPTPSVQRTPAPDPTHPEPTPPAILHTRRCVDPAAFATAFPARIPTQSNPNLEPVRARGVSSPTPGGNHDPALQMALTHVRRHISDIGGTLDDRQEQALFAQLCIHSKKCSDGPLITNARLTVSATITGIPATVLLDTGCSSYIMSDRFVKRHRFRTRPSRVELQYAARDSKGSATSYVVEDIVINGWARKLPWLVANIRPDEIIGLPWFLECPWPSTNLSTVHGT